ncbi:hypothetical protein [Thalassospira lucentensis]|uniref:hypothetical protein n=1 Tax=Thalassospira lucentensis TaxID=168935 RepID=UPI003AA7CA3F
MSVPLGAGRALFRLCAARPEPIPFFDALGSVKPMFMTSKAVAARGEELGRGWPGSLTMWAGQLCTNPGIAVVIDGPDADAFVASVKEALSELEAQTMLSDGMAETYRVGAKLRARKKFRPRRAICAMRRCTCLKPPVKTGCQTMNWEVRLWAACLVVRVKDVAEMSTIAF